MCEGNLQPLFLLFGTNFICNFLEYFFSLASAFWQPHLGNAKFDAIEHLLGSIMHPYVFAFGNLVPLGLLFNENLMLEKIISSQFNWIGSNLDHKLRQPVIEPQRQPVVCPNLCSLADWNIGVWVKMHVFESHVVRKKRATCSTLLYKSQRSNIWVQTKGLTRISNKYKMVICW